MKVLAIDPGYDRLGVAVLEGAAGAETLCVFSPLRLIYSFSARTSTTHDMGHVGNRELF
jgi:hypothetical protein